MQEKQNSSLEDLVRSYVMFRSDTEVETFPIAYKDAMRTLYEYDYRKYQITENEAAVEVLEYLQKLYGYTLFYDERIHGEYLWGQHD